MHRQTIGWSCCLKISKSTGDGLPAASMPTMMPCGRMWRSLGLRSLWQNVSKGLQQSGIENLIFFINYGGIENRKVLDSLELFAAKVMPLFKD